MDEFCAQTKVNSLNGHWYAHVQDNLGITQWKNSKTRPSESLIQIILLLIFTVIILKPIST